MKTAATFFVSLLMVIAFQSSLFAQYSGPSGGVVGIVVGSRNGDIVVEKVRSGMGADRAGLVEGDIILAIDGFPVSGRPLDEVQTKLGGGVGTDVSLTIRRAGGDQEIVSVIRDPLVGSSDAGLPIRMAMEKPHDLRPEDGMVCKIISASGRNVTIGCGENAGVDPRQHVRFTHRSDYGSRKKIADGSVRKVHAYTSDIAVGKNASSLKADDVIAVTSAWRSERARENTLWRVAARGINLLDYPTGLPYATIDQLRFDTQLALEKAAVTKMAERIQEAADVIYGLYNGKISSGEFRGKSLPAALKSTTPQSVMSFLRFLNTYPDNYVGRDWSLPEVYATWVINGTP